MVGRDVAAMRARSAQAHVTPHEEEQEPAPSVPASTEAILRLQRGAGNRAVSAMLAANVLQRCPPDPDTLRPPSQSNVPLPASVTPALDATADDPVGTPTAPATTTAVPLPPFHASVLVAPAGPNRFTYAWGKTGKLMEALRTAGRTTATDTDPGTGTRTVTLTPTAGGPDQVFEERVSPFPADAEYGLGLGTPEVQALLGEFSITGAAAQREVLRMLLSERNRTKDLKGLIKVVRRALNQLVPGSDKSGADQLLTDRATAGAKATAATQKVRDAATRLRAAGILSSPEWLGCRDAGTFAGVVGEFLATGVLRQAAQPDQAVLKNVHFVGDIFTDQQLQTPHRIQGRDAVDVDVVSELDLMTCAVSGQTYTTVELANVKAVGRKSASDESGKAQKQNAAAELAIRSGIGTPFAHEGKWCVVKRVTAIDTATGAELDLTGRLQLGGGTAQSKVGLKDTRDDLWDRVLDYNEAEVADIVDVLREHELKSTPRY